MPTTAGTAQLVHTPTILVDSQELPHTAMLAEARISQTIGSASRLELRFYDDNFVLVDSSTFAVGGQITVAISNASGAETPSQAHATRAPLST